MDVRAKKAYLWLTNLSKTACKQQSVYLGSSKFGYNVFGYGCSLFDIDHTPTDYVSKEFADVIGLYTPDGRLANTVKVGYKEYGTLEQISRLLSFRRFSTLLKKNDNVRKTFQPSVAEDLIKLLNNGR